jgi:membrane-associated phospholipid phosphatase
MLAIALTVLIVISGLDWKYFLITRGHISFDIFFPSVVIGGILPFIIPITMILWGIYKNDMKARISGWAVGQAAFLGFILSSFYKIFTGRIEPNLMNTIYDISHYFQFGIFRHGIFFGWPSSHTAVAFAMAFAIFVIYKNSRQIKYLYALYALYIGIGVATVGIHWLSEFVAGAIIGAVVGISVGQSFLKLEHRYK